MTIDFKVEKEEIINKINLIEDVELIQSINNILDIKLHQQNELENSLEASIERALIDSREGRVRLYQDFIGEVRKKYQA